MISTCSYIDMSDVLIYPRRIVFSFDLSGLCGRVATAMHPVLTLITGESAMRDWIALVRQARNTCRRRRLICESLGHADAALYAEISSRLDDILFAYSAYAYN